MKKNENLKIEFLGEKLLNARKEKGLSQEELADKINVSRQSIHLWESGKIVPDLENIINLCNVLDITTDKLTNGLDIIKNKKSKIKFKKVFILIILIIIFLFFNITIYRFSIIHKINNNVDKYNNLSNYHYVLTTYKMKNENVIDLFENNIYYKDGIYKEVMTENNKEIGIIWIDFNQKEGYTVNLIDKTISQLNLNEKVAISKEDGIYNLRESVTDCNNIMVEIILSLSPNVKISNSKEEYIVEYKQNAQETYNTKVWIDKETGLPNDKIRTSNNIDIFERREYEIGKVKDEDVKKIDIYEYTMK